MGKYWKTTQNKLVVVSSEAGKRTKKAEQKQFGREMRGEV